MNKLFIIFSIVLWSIIGLMASCTNPVVIPPIDPVPVVTPSPSPSPVHYISVLNSKWEIVKQEVMASGSRAITSADAIKADIAAYNAAHISDQWFLVDGEVPALEDAPPCSIFIVDKSTHEVIIGEAGPFMHLGWPRKQLVDNYEGWQKDAISAAGELYIDVIPPAPTPLTAEQLYAKYSCYVINNVGQIKYEKHCDVVPEGFEGQTVDQYFYTIMQWMQLITRSDAIGEPDAPWTVISGYVYTAP